MIIHLYRSLKVFPILDPRITFRFSTQSSKTEEFGDIRLVYNFEIDSIQLHFPRKPTQEVINEAKIPRLSLARQPDGLATKLTNDGISAAQIIARKGPAL